MNNNLGEVSGNIKKKGKGGLWVILVVLLVALLIIALYYAQSYYDDRLTDRLYPRPYKDLVFAASEKYDIPVEVLYSVMKVESNFNPTAESRMGALGLMQILPDTFEELCKKRKEKHSTLKLLDPKINIDYGAYYMRYLIDYYKGDMTLVYAAYNAGMGNVNKWLKSQGGTLTEIPFTETRKYVERVNNTIDIYKKLIY